MHISELHIYPVKGAAGSALPRVELDAFGPRHDRRWMIVDAEGQFISQRSHPRLVLLAVALDAGALVLRSLTAGELRLPATLEAGAPTRAHVWEDTVAALDAGREAADFVSAHLESPARLVYMPDATLRQADLDYAEPGDRVSFADAFPLLLISQASLDALNARLAEPIPMSRFRPNVVVHGAPAPHAEDGWRTIELGAIPCDVVKPCARCAVTTVDAETARSGKEPLRTLDGYRRWNGQVWFGQNVIHRAHGWLAVGDAVAVRDTGAARPPIELQ
jgi:uncharacterized protein